MKQPWREKVEIGDAVLYLGDAAGVVPSLFYDVLITDPPYGVGLTAKATKHGKIKGAIGKGYIGRSDSVDELAALMPTIELALRGAKRALIFSGNRNIHLYPPPAALGCVFNPAGAGRGPWGFTCFNAVLFYGTDCHRCRLPDSWEQRGGADFAEKNGHPCPKPLGMMSWAVYRASLGGETILDPFMGSGTTALPCLWTGRKFIGIEIEKTYFDIACRRIEREYTKPQLFGMSILREKPEGLFR